MKFKLLGLIFVLGLTSCSVDDPKIVTIQNANVVNVVAPDTLNFGQTEVFLVEYLNPTNCHTFEGFDVISSEPETKTIRTETRFEETFDCDDTPNDFQVVEFEFFVESQEDHSIRFLRGASDTGQLLYFTFNLPVKVE
jgi:hypothetical protein